MGVWTSHFNLPMPWLSSQKLNVLIKKKKKTQNFSSSFLNVFSSRFYFLGGKFLKVGGFVVLFLFIIIITSSSWKTFFLVENNFSHKVF